MDPYTNTAMCKDATPPHERAAQNWAAAKERLNAAQAALMAAQAAVEQAHKAEIDTWGVLETASGRAAAGNCVPGSYGVVR
jgi:hypothetical protein